MRRRGGLSERATDDPGSRYLLRVKTCLIRHAVLDPSSPPDLHLSPALSVGLHSLPPARMIKFLHHDKYVRAIALTLTTNTDTLEPRA